MSRHSFDPEVAAELGVNAAVIYQNIVWWCEKNAANGKHLHEGRHWTYNSVKAFSDLFPYMTADQIRRALQRLEEAGYIGVGNFNATPTDRTKWFCDLRQMHLASVPNGSGMDAKSYKDTDSKPVGKPDGKPLGAFQAFWDAFPHRKGKKDKRTLCEEKFARAVRGGVDPLVIIGAAEEYRNDEDVKRGYGRAASTWLHQRGWEDERAPPQEDFHAKIDELLRGNGNELRRTDEIDNRARQPLLAGMEAPGTPDERDCDEAPSVHRGSYQQEVASLVKPRRIGGSMR